MHIASSSSTCEMFLKSAIEKILAEKDIRRKENQELKKACESAIEELKLIVGENGTSNGIVPTRDVTIKAENYLLSFELACKSKSPKIVNIALDCLQKLVSYGHINGYCVDKTNPDRNVTDRVISIICSSFNREHADETILLQILKAILAVVLSNECEVHEKALLDGVRICFTIFLVTKSPINEATARGSLSQVINCVFTRMEKMGDEKDDERIIDEIVDSIVQRVTNDSMNISPERIDAPSSTTGSDSISDLPIFANIYQKDAYLVFRALCVLSQKGEGDANDPKDTHVRSKTFALEMLLLILQNSGRVLQNCVPFIHLIKRSLCVTLSNNAISPIVTIFEKTLAIFIELLYKMKQHLKPQIEVFFKELILSMLDSPSCSFEHRWILLNTVSKVVCTPQTLVDIFVNYDCDLTCHNIFGSLVEVISKMARMPISDISPQKERDREMRLLGLDCLVEMIKCQVEWYISCENHEVSIKEGEKNEDSFNHIEQQKQMKDKMEQGIYLFGKKPKDGLAFLQEHGFVGEGPEEIAEFLLKEERLDKTVVGDFLGDSNEFNKKVMYAYVDEMDFSSQDLVGSLRFFLEKFRLPGEAQKIDRLMEKFASRYCECNPSLGIFASADTAYVLAYSVILLTTDLHSSQVRHKMTKEQYVSMNRGINNGGDLDKEYLESIYDDISANEIKMKGGASKLLKAQGRKTDAKLEMAAMSETTRVLMESASKNDSLFVYANHQYHVKPMFKMCWTCALAAFSLGVQMSDDTEEWKLCLKGFRYCIRLASLIDATTERNAFIQALGRFTLLAPRSIMAEMKEKNIEAIKLMLAIGDESGNELGDNWLDILKCVSQLELVSLIGTGLRSTNVYDGYTSAHYVAKSTGQDEKSLSSLQTTLTETASQSVVLAVDRLFENSSRLSGDGVVCFVSALCQISRDELSLPSGPRMFLLSKIVEVALYNMDRIRLEWSRIWNVIGDHLRSAGCNENEIVAHFSVDALRQLAIKFMERGELPNYRFQKEFLRPFEVIMARNGNEGTRELVIACTSLMVEGHGDKIKSGWMNLFSIWTIAGGDTHIDIVESTFSVVSNAIHIHFKCNFSNIVDAFQEALKCLTEFACNSHLSDMSMEAIGLIRLCAECVSENEEVIRDAPWEDKFSVTSEERIWLRGWFPIFFELSCIINRCKLDIRTRSLTVLFDILKCYGNSIRIDWWKDLFRIIFRIFEHAKVDDNRGDKTEWMATTCNHTLYSIVDIFSQFFPIIGPPLLPSLYQQFLFCLDQKNEQLARSSISCLSTIVIMNGVKFNDDLWKETINTLTYIFQSTLPNKLLEQNGETKDKDEEEDRKRNGINNLNWLKDEDIGDVIFMCIVQSDIVDTVSSIVVGNEKEEGFFSNINPNDILSLCECLQSSLSLAKKFNSSNGERTLLWKAGLRGSSKPNLTRQETRCLSTLFSILIRLLQDDRAIHIRPKVSNMLCSSVGECLDSFSRSESEGRRVALSPVLTHLFKECLSMDRSVILSSLGHQFPFNLCDLVITAECKQLRTQLSYLLKLFCTR